jgi:hypothetical protein
VDGKSGKVYASGSIDFGKRLQTGNGIGHGIGIERDFFVQSRGYIFCIRPNLG